MKELEPKAAESLISPLPLNRPASQPKRRKRLKLWEIPESRHCMVIGTCLSVTEARSQLKRVGLDVRHLNDYQVHTYAVQTAGDKKNHLAVRLQRQLDEKYAIEIRRFSQAKSTEELSELWYRTVSEGTIAGAVWAACTHPCIDEMLSYEVFGEVHMMSHLQGACSRRDNEQLLQARSRSQALEAELSSLRVVEQRRSERDLARIAELSQELSQLRVQYYQSKAKPESAERAAGEKSCKELIRQRQLAVLQAERVERLNERVQEEQAENQSLSARIAELEASNLQLEQTIENLLPCGAKKDDCASDLRGRCILYLGGHNHLCQRFRTIVESKKGQFIHHDGGREQQLKQLQGLLQKADMVFCPTEKISHNAMNKARKLCRENPEKPIVYLERPSISAFVNGLNQLPGSGLRSDGVVDSLPTE